MKTKNIKYPYLPPGRDIKYVLSENEYMKEAKVWAKEFSLDKTMPTGSVIVKDSKIIGKGANGSNFHQFHECERVKRGIPTGQGYELCEGCHPRNHSEPNAIKNAKDSGFDAKGADLYMWGHWWCCKNCWEAMITENIKNVYLLENSEILFNKKDPGNITGGRQFDK